VTCDLLRFTFASVGNQRSRASGSRGRNTGLKVGRCDKVMEGMVFGIVEGESRLVSTCSGHHLRTSTIVVVIVGTLGTKLAVCGLGCMVCGCWCMVFLFCWVGSWVHSGCHIGFVRGSVRRAVCRFVRWAIGGLLCDVVVMVNVFHGLVVVVLLDSVVVVDSVRGVVVLNNDLWGYIRSRSGHRQRQGVSFDQLGDVTQTLELVALVVGVFLGVLGLVSCLRDFIGVRHIVGVRRSFVHGLLVVRGVWSGDQMVLRDTRVRGVRVLNRVVVSLLAVGSVRVLYNMMGVHFFVSGVGVVAGVMTCHTMGGSVRIRYRVMMSDFLIRGVSVGHGIVVCYLVVCGIRV